jgi:phospholipid/cholesterol/gamma-HCH transport system substrate-binding protein
MGKNNRALMTGLFLLVLISITTVIIFWMGHFNQQRNHYTIATHFSVSGLSPQSTVFFRGIAVGKVLSVQFDPDNSGIILIPIEVDKNIILTRGVFSTLRLRGVTGLNQIELNDDGRITEPLPPDNSDPDYRIPMRPSMTDKLFDSGEQLLAKADRIMARLDNVLNDQNIDNIAGILGNLKNFSNKLTDLNKSLDKALVGIPDLSRDAQGTLKHINALTVELKSLSADLRTLSVRVGTLSDKAGGFADTGKNMSVMMMQSTLPKMNILLNDLQTTSRQVRNTANLLEKNPQSLLFGAKRQEPGPGEPDFEEQQ